MITLSANARGTSPGADEFEVKVAGTAVDLADTNPVAVSGKTITLTLAAAVTAGQTVTVSYAPDAEALASETEPAGPVSVAFTDKAVSNNTNSAPTVANAIPDQTAKLNEAFSFQFAANTFADVNSGDTLTYTATKSDDSALPNWLSFTASTRTFSGTPATAGTVTVKVTANDGNGGTVSDSFDITAVANYVPTVANAIPDQSVKLGASLSYQFPANTFSDADGDTLTYTATKGDGTSLPSWLSFAAGTRTFSGTAPSTAGTVSVKVTASDGNGGSVSDSFDIVVEANVAPTVANGIPDQVATEGSAFSFQFAANTFNDADGDTLTYSATKGDGTSLPSWLSFAAGTRTFSGTPQEEDIGTLSVKVTASDGNGGSVSDTFDIVVSEATAAPDAQRRAVRSTVAALGTRMAASALDNIGDRLGDGVPALSLTLAGESLPITGPGAAATGRNSPYGPNPGSCRDGFGRGYGLAGFGAGTCTGAGGRDVDADAMLSASAFSLPLGPAAGEAGFDPNAPLWSVWGRGDLEHFAGRPEPGMRFRGKTRTGWIGVDARGPIRGSGGSRRWVAGLAVSRGTSGSDYSFDGGGDSSEWGRLETEMSALWPYGRWTLENGLELRGMAGAGAGSLRHVPGGDDPVEESKLRMWSVSVGLKRKLPPLNRIDMAAQGDASFVRMETARGEQTIDGQRTDSWRVRVGVEGSRSFEAEGGRTFTPFLELAARQDGGDGLTGTGLEVAGGVRHGAPGISIELRGRWLAAHTMEDTEEHGVSLTVRLLPKDHGRGLSLSLSSRGGADTGGADALWREELPAGHADAEATGRLEGELGYGLPMFGNRFTGTPNLGFGLSDEARDWRIGWRLISVVRNYPGFEVNLDATRREVVNSTVPPKHGVMLNATLNW